MLQYQCQASIHALCLPPDPLPQADLTTKDCHGNSCQSLAEQNNTSQMLELLSSKNKKPLWHLLHRAISLNSLRTVSLLLDCHFMDINAHLPRGPTGTLIYTFQQVLEYWVTYCL